MSVTLGTHSKMTALPAERSAIRRFYHDVLECEQITSSERVDVFALGPRFSLGIIYDDAAPSAAEMLKALWLELDVSDVEALKQRILDFGAAEIDYSDKSHFYFQAPGGQVFRLAAA